MQNNKIDADETYRTLIIIWFALVMSQIIFVVLIYFVKPEVFQFDLTKPILGDSPIIVVVIGLVSLMNLVSSFRRRKKFLAQAVDRQDVGLVQTALILGGALSESVSLFGVLLAFAFDYQYFFVFSAVGIVGTLLHFPRRSDVHAASFRSTAI